MNNNQQPSKQQNQLTKQQSPPPAITVTPVTTPVTTSPNTLTVPSKQVIAQGMQRVGKHGKSHHQYIKVMNQHQPTKDFRPITMQQLSKHNTLESAWLSLNGVVYDVTVYMDFHPGGNILLQGCGKECAGLFSNFCFIILDKYHPWVNGKYLLDKYQIGFLA